MGESVFVLHPFFGPVCFFPKGTWRPVCRSLLSKQDNLVYFCVFQFFYYDLFGGFEKNRRLGSVFLKGLLGNSWGLVGYFSGLDLCGLKIWAALLSIECLV
jgi:hypothetical protein